MTGASDRSRRVTLMDVARHAGVSRATASLVLRESPLVAEPTRLKVRDAVRELGYVYNRGAASLRMRRSHTVGLVISGLANPFFADFIEGVERELRPAGYVAFLANTFDDPERQGMLIRTLLEHQIDGMLIVAAAGSSAEIGVPPEAVDIPYVLATRPVPGVAASYVGTDNRAGARMAVDHLLGHGARRIAYFGGPEDGAARMERQAAVAERLAESESDLDPAWTVPSPVSTTDGQHVARALVSSSAPPDAVIAHSDAIAFGVMRSLRDAGIEVGTRCRVVGFDDVEQARAWSPSLTSVSVKAATLGGRAAQMLLERIRAPEIPPESLVLEPQLVVRESCGCGRDS
ncbi:LacI family transcriptional regulator [Actinobacteria bacterium YIM 96077]|uniref:LacI family transcriptional regulator n=1 Tax=Phytoactinopolyspora halophila TaxID=1981511 RepID=A0A329QNN3_9ACTN|nr:LacI family DNA-binding transcriptional regulator [Phytoactinopolyspora halophila]AYY12306.1 LacI family transcriptional regulator [Actinobacteria bacterium YIM 96077]RAW13776.1 LacI family transcriptional regulator [Phytoactinopolyspora halophila]